MMKRLTAFVSLAILVSLTSAFAAEDQIDFADLGGIRSFRPDGDVGIYIEGRNQQWYHAGFFRRCPELKFNESIGFVVEPTGQLNRFSSILVDGDRCYFRSFEPVPEPK